MTHFPYPAQNTLWMHKKGCAAEGQSDTFYSMTTAVHNLLLAPQALFFIWLTTQMFALGSRPVPNPGFEEGGFPIMHPPELTHLSKVNEEALSLFSQSACNPTPACSGMPTKAE